MDKIKDLKDIIDNSKRIVFFTGAGISVPSGIPDFRSATGLYQDKHAEEMISHSFFLADPLEFFRFYKEKMCFPNAKPNNAHKWIADLEKEGKSLGVITQNIDGLHQKAGSKCAIELHGSIYRNYCMKCHKAYSLDEILAKDIVPICDCGGIIKPDVVLYEEGLNEYDIYKAIEMISKADTLIIIGTSLMVYPAASYIGYFKGDNLIVINKGEIRPNREATLTFNADVIEVIRRLKEIC